MHSKVSSRSITWELGTIAKSSAHPGPTESESAFHKVSRWSTCTSKFGEHCSGRLHWEFRLGSKQKQPWMLTLKLTLPVNWTGRDSNKPVTMFLWIRSLSHHGPPTKPWADHYSYRQRRKLIWFSNLNPLYVTNNLAETKIWNLPSLILEVSFFCTTQHPLIIDWFEEGMRSSLQKT